MNLISLLGIFVLLGFAWILSYDKSLIPFKIIFWGIGLQFVFALIILRHDYWSFVGMGILAILIIAFQFKDREYTNPKKLVFSFLTVLPKKKHLIFFDLFNIFKVFFNL